MSTNPESIPFAGPVIKDLEALEVTERHYFIFNRMKKFGLSSASSVLQLGCGKGFLTRLLAGAVKAGKIEAIDKDPNALSVAKQAVIQDNVTFIESNILGYHPMYQRYDFVTLFDVLDHLKPSQRPPLFDEIAHRLHVNSWLMVTIPHPAVMAFDEKEHPEFKKEGSFITEVSELVELASSNGLELYHFETTSIWRVDDYFFAIFRKKRNFQETWVMQQLTPMQKVTHHMRLAMQRLKFGKK